MHRCFAFCDLSDRSERASGFNQQPTGRADRQRLASAGSRNAAWLTLSVLHCGRGFCVRRAENGWDNKAPPGPADCNGGAVALCGCCDRTTLCVLKIGDSPDVTTGMMERDKKKKYAELARRDGADFLAFVMPMAAGESRP